MKTYASLFYYGECQNIAFSEKKQRVTYNSTISSMYNIGPSLFYGLEWACEIQKYSHVALHVF
jgi:hypothetical protein